MVRPLANTVSPPVCNYAIVFTYVAHYRPAGSLFLHSNAPRTHSTHTHTTLARTARVLKHTIGLHARRLVAATTQRPEKYEFLIAAYRNACDLIVAGSALRSEKTKKKGYI